ncbi:MAG: hypothetical protein ACLRQF_18735 [Thomasclavelia ramosa]
MVESTSGVTIVDAHREKQNIYLEYAPTIYALTAAIDAKTIILLPILKMLLIMLQN